MGFSVSGIQWTFTAWGLGAWRFWVKGLRGDRVSGFRGGGGLNPKPYTRNPKP